MNALILSYDEAVEALQTWNPEDVTMSHYHRNCILHHLQQADKWRIKELEEKIKVLVEDVDYYRHHYEDCTCKD